MNALWLVIGLFVGVGVAALALVPRLRRLSTRNSDLERELIRAESDLAHERSLSEERLKTLSDAQVRLSDTFRALSAEAVQAGMAQLSELARSQRKSAQAEAQ